MLSFIFFVSFGVIVTALSNSQQRLHSSAFAVPGINASYDYVVVGGGTAGLAIASRLAESASVAVIEAGGWYEIDNGNLSVVPAGVMQMAVLGTAEDTPRQPLMDWDLISVPQTGANNQRIHYAQGKTLGGSSAHNTMGYHRATKGSYQRWADVVGDQSYTFPNILPYFKKSAHLTPPNLEKRNTYNATVIFDPTVWDNSLGGVLQVSWANWVYSGTFIELSSEFWAAQLLTSEYLSYVYRHIKYSIEASTSGSWTGKAVEFNFSMPTTWKALGILNGFEKAIQNAGFGAESQRHSVKLGLTEAEAAAVYVATNPQVRFTNGDIVLVCDAGGGTTDLGLTEIEDATIPRLKQVDAVSGVGIGSTMIDGAFQELVQRRLQKHPDGYTFPPELPRRLCKSTQFQSIKHKFGSPAANLPEFPIKLDTLGLNISQACTSPGLGIDKGRMRFSNAEIQSLFDTQIRGITKKIDEQLQWMKANRNGQAPKSLILSGGLGGSEYVKTQLEQRYGPSGLMIVRSQEPRLSVMKGLVMDRKQKLISGTSTLKTRIARASYGVICRQLYDPAQHPGAEVQLDFYNKKQRWAINQIEWLIRKGDTIDTDTAKEKPFAKKLQPGETSRQWDTKVVISHNDRNSLPRMLRQAGAHELCTVRANLQEVGEHEFELKNKRCWQGRRYYNARFTIRVIVGPADLRFELWFKGMKYNRSHDPVQIEWDAAGAGARPISREGRVGGGGDVDFYGRFR